MEVNVGSVLYYSGSLCLLLFSKMGELFLSVIFYWKLNIMELQYFLSPTSEQKYKFYSTVTHLTGTPHSSVSIT